MVSEHPAKSARRISIKNFCARALTKVSPWPGRAAPHVDFFAVDGCIKVGGSNLNRLHSRRDTSRLAPKLCGRLLRSLGTLATHCAANICATTVKIHCRRHCQHSAVVHVFTRRLPAECVNDGVQYLCMIYCPLQLAFGALRPPYSVVP